MKFRFLRILQIDHTLIWICKLPVQHASLKKYKAGIFFRIKSKRKKLTDLEVYVIANNGYNRYFYQPVILTQFFSRSIEKEWVTTLPH